MIETLLLFLSKNRVRHPLIVGILHFVNQVKLNMATKSLVLTVHLLLLSFHVAANIAYALSLATAVDVPDPGGVDVSVKMA